MPNNRLLMGDSRDALQGIDADSIDACVTDPPYELTSIIKRFGSSTAAPPTCDVFVRGASGFMGHTWDAGGIQRDPEFWSMVWRVLKPGAYGVAFGGTRTYHRMVCAIEDAGFLVRDTICWHFASGFPKSHNIAKAIKRTLGNGTEEAKRYDGWGTALKPATELICLFQKPISEATIALNVLKHGTGALNLPACTIPGISPDHSVRSGNSGYKGGFKAFNTGLPRVREGRWPAGVMLDEHMAGVMDVQSGITKGGGVKIAANAKAPKSKGRIYNSTYKNADSYLPIDEGGGSRFFFISKASQEERHVAINNPHPTIKPVALCRELCKLICPPGGTVIDPFMGSGTTGIAAFIEGFEFVGIERDEEYFKVARTRIDHARGNTGLFMAEGDADDDNQQDSPTGGLFEGE